MQDILLRKVNGVVLLIKPEIVIREDGVKLTRLVSDQGKYLRQKQTGILYEDAVDLPNTGFTYEEADEYINQEENDVHI